MATATYDKGLVCCAFALLSSRFELFVLLQLAIKYTLSVRCKPPERDLTLALFVAARSALLARLVKSPLPSNTTKYSRLPQTTVAAWEMMKNASSTVARTASELQTSQRQRVRIPTPVMAATASGQATPMREASAVEEGEDASGRAGTAGPLVPSDKDGATDVQNNGLDEGEIPGKDFKAVTNVLCYLTRMKRSFNLALWQHP